MKLLYLAGKYRAISLKDQARNIELARQRAADLWSSDVAVLCPHSNTAYFEVYRKDLPDQVWITGGLEMIGRCDAIYMMSGWKDSRGACMELDYALKHGLEIIDEEKG